MTLGDQLGRTVKQVVVTIVGAAITLVGIALLVLPGPGLLLVLLGLVVLSTQFPAVHRIVDPVRRHAMQAAEQSVCSPLRVAGSVLVGLGLIGAGLVWSRHPTLPFGGWATGIGLIASGLILLALLVYSRRQVTAHRAAHRPTVHAGAASHPGRVP